MYDLPLEIVAKIEALCLGFDLKALQKAVAHLTKKYAASTSTITALKTYEEHLAYLICRMPATFAVNKAVFSKIKTPISSLLDVGAGPATAYLAAQPHTATLVERDAVFIQLAQKLLGERSNISWHNADICSMKCDDAYDVVSASYVLSELSQVNVEPLVNTLWEKTEQTLVLIETGTPKGYQRLMQARSLLIGNNATIVHPCPHHLACPMPENAWCHFSVRIARSKLHRKIKGAELGYEDEKFSYIIASRNAARDDQGKARLAGRLAGCLVGTPQKRSGHVLLPLCTPEGTLKTETVSRKNAERYGQAKKAHWGDLL